MACNTAPLLFSSVLYFGLLAIQFLQVAFADPKPVCYFPDGTLRDSLDYVPCNNIQGQYSMCCATANRGGIDTCLPSGLCAGPVIQDKNTQPLWRESCSDPTWKSPKCVKICMFGNWLKHDAPLTLCPDGSLCCGNGNFTCCEKLEGVVLPATVGESSPSTTTTSTSILSSKTAVSHTSVTRDQKATTSNSSSRIETSKTQPTDSTSVVSATSPGQSKTGDFSSATSNSGPRLISTGLKIAIIVGGIALVLVLCAAIVVLAVYCHRKRRKKPKVYQKNTQGPVELENVLNVGVVNPNMRRPKSLTRTLYGGEMPTNHNTPYVDEGRRHHDEMYEMM
ncbi:hypothetical protein TWF694_003746 [Orbilia ellipsospora]|uniref:Mid2 domain-containing protein n=1 Tax=Orbilia ellipsospora TaxID=2528407 RepID=A0AAV9X1B6_9PEZI